MPWLHLQETIEFGSIRIWDFYKEGSTRIVDSREMLWLAQLMSCFKGDNDKEKQRIGIIQNGDVPFSEQDLKDNSKIRWAANAIGFSFLTSVLARQIKLAPEAAYLGSSEQFASMSMVIDAEAGLFYTDNSKDKYSNMEQHRPLFREPPQMSDKLNSPDRLLLKGLASINDKHFESSLWRRLEVCFEWFMMAWTTSPDVSHPARFIALMTSFEALVKEKNENAVSMGLKTIEICGWSDLAKTESYEKKENKAPISIPTNKPHKFIIDFAKWRNSLVHGELVRYGWIRHIVGERKFEPRLVMSFVIYSLVLNTLINENLFDEFEAASAKSSIDKILKLLHWDTCEPIDPSTH